MPSRACGIKSALTLRVPILAGIFVLLTFVKGYSEPPQIIKLISHNDFSISQLTSWTSDHPEQSDLPLGKLVLALTDQKRSYSPQALSKLRSLCTTFTANAVVSDQSEVYQIACIYYLLQLTKMARDDEALTLYKDLKLKPWWHDRSSYLKGLIDDHIQASCWRTGTIDELLSVIYNKKPKSYNERRDHQIKLIRLKSGSPNARPVKLLEEFNQWAKQYRLTDADRDYRSLISLKTKLLGSAGFFNERHALLKKLSSSNKGNPAIFPELRLAASAIDLGEISLCSELIKSGNERLNMSPPHLRTLIYTEHKLSASWCALALGHPELAYRLAKQLTDQPQRVGLRYWTRDQWSLMVSATRYIALEAYVQLISTLPKWQPFLRLKLWWERLWLKRQVLSQLHTVISTKTPASHPAELVLLPLSFYPKLFSIIGDTTELFIRYPINHVTPWLERWLKVALMGQPLVKGEYLSTPESLRLIAEQSHGLKGSCDSLIRLSTGLSLLYGCPLKILVNLPRDQANDSSTIYVMMNDEKLVRYDYKFLPGRTISLGKSIEPLHLILTESSYDEITLIINKLAN